VISPANLDALYLFVAKVIFILSGNVYLDKVLSLLSEVLDISIPRELAYQMFISAPMKCRDVVMRLIALRDVSLEDFKSYRVLDTVENMYFALTVLSSVPFLRNPSQSRVEALRKSVDEIGRFVEECKNRPPGDVLPCLNAASLHSIMANILNKVVGEGEGSIKVPEAFVLGSLIRATIIARELGISDMLHLFLAFSCTYRSPDKFVKRMVKIYNNEYYFYQLRLGGVAWTR
jgi:hypothetical protein